MIPKRIQKILTNRRRVVDLCHSEMEAAEGWRLRLKRKLHTRLLKNAPISESALLSLIPSELTCDSADVLSRVVAGQLESMMLGDDPSEWTGDEAWHTVQCTDVFPVFIKKSVVFSKVVLDILEGKASGKVPSIVVPEWKLCPMAAKAMARSDSAEPYVYDLAGMYFGVVLSRDDLGRVRMGEVEVSAPERDWNRSLMNTRADRCIKGLFKECDYCRLGRTECSSAYHALSFGRGVCSQCGHPKRYITPQGICWECIREENLPDVEKRKNIEETCQNDPI